VRRRAIVSDIVECLDDPSPRAVLLGAAPVRECLETA
jgi:hypothetical protein